MTAAVHDDRTADLLSRLQLLEGTLRAGFQRGMFSLAKQAWCLTALSEARVEVSALAGALEAYRTWLTTVEARQPTRSKRR